MSQWFRTALALTWIAAQEFRAANAEALVVRGVSWYAHAYVWVHGHLHS